MMKNTAYHSIGASFLTLAASAAFVLAGCSKTETVPQDGRTELRLTSTIEMTRAGSADTQATQIASDEKVTVWVTDSGNSASLYALELTAGSDGTLAGDTKMYYPQTGGGVSIAALHGDFVFPTAGIPSEIPDAIDFSVSRDQSVSGGGNYLKSDLLYAARSARRSNAAVNLEFYHLLSKLELNISKSAEITDGITGVTLDGVADYGTFTPGEITDISNLDSRAKGISAGLNADRTIALGTSLSETNEAIAVPQNMAGKTLTFKLSSGGELVYTFPTGTVFESGRKYVYNVTLKLTELSVSSSIIDWTTGGTESGSATME